jgi:hypothetical protein
VQCERFEELVPVHPADSHSTLHCSQLAMQTTQSNTTHFMTVSFPKATFCIIGIARPLPSNPSISPQHPKSRSRSSATRSLAE